MASFISDLENITVDMVASVTHKPGAIQLGAFPLLVYAPAQHGPGIRLDNGESVEEIFKAAKAGKTLADLSRQFKTTELHIKQAIAYVTTMGHMIAATS